jgi:hypothetical protein
MELESGAVFFELPFIPLSRDDEYPAASPALFFIKRRARGLLRSSWGLRSLKPRGLPRSHSFHRADN